VGCDFGKKKKKKNLAITELIFFFSSFQDESDVGTFADR
jgi:hypothetical protein